MTDQRDEQRRRNDARTRRAGVRLLGLAAVTTVATLSIVGCQGTEDVSKGAFCTKAREAVALEPSNMQIDDTDVAGLQQAWSTYLGKVSTAEGTAPASLKVAYTKNANMLRDFDATLQSHQYDLAAASSDAGFLQKLSDPAVESARIDVEAYVTEKCQA